MRNLKKVLLEFDEGDDVNNSDLSEDLEKIYRIKIEEIKKG